MNIPSCKNCIHYIPDDYSNYSSNKGKCALFGEKDVVTNKIHHDYADTCRRDHTKCGLEGRYFEKNENVKLTKLFHLLKRNMFSIVNLLIVGGCIVFVNSV